MLMLSTTFPMMMIMTFWQKDHWLVKLLLVIHNIHNIDTHNIVKSYGKIQFLVFVFVFVLIKLIDGNGFRLLWQQAIVEFSWPQTGFWLMSMTLPLITNNTGEDDENDHYDEDDDDDDDVDDDDDDDDDDENYDFWLTSMILSLKPTTQVKMTMIIFMIMVMILTMK